jgi:hypothetical protein
MKSFIRVLVPLAIVGVVVVSCHSDKRRPIVFTKDSADNAVVIIPFEVDADWHTNIIVGRFKDTVLHQWVITMYPSRFNEGIGGEGLRTRNQNQGRHSGLETSSLAIQDTIGEVKWPLDNLTHFKMVHPDWGGQTSKQIRERFKRDAMDTIRVDNWDWPPLDNYRLDTIDGWIWVNEFKKDSIKHRPTNFRVKTFKGYSYPRMMDDTVLGYPLPDTAWIKMDSPFPIYKLIIDPNSKIVLIHNTKSKP